MADPRPLSRPELARIAGNSPEAIRSLERLFQVAGDLLPADIVRLNAAIDATSLEANAAQAAATSYTPPTMTLDRLDLRRIGSNVRERGLSWDPVDATLDVGMEYGVVQQVGMEAYARVLNDTGSTLSNGSVVGFVGAGAGSALRAVPFIADGTFSSFTILGLMTHDLPDGESGYCTIVGKVRELDTSAFTAGDIVYPSASVAGALTNIKPTAPNNVIPMGVCVVSDATEGVLFIRPSIEQVEYYGTFSKTTDQTPTAPNTAAALTMDTVDISNGLTIGTPSSRLVTPASGLFAVGASIQAVSNNASKKDVYLWLRKNGVDIPNSTRIGTSDISGGYVEISVHETVSMEAGDYIEVLFAATDANITIKATTATGFAPATSAALVSITQIQQ